MKRGDANTHLPKLLISTHAKSLGGLELANKKPRGHAT